MKPIPHQEDSKPFMQSDQPGKKRAIDTDSQYEMLMLHDVEWIVSHANAMPTIRHNQLGFVRSMN